MSEDTSKCMKIDTDSSTQMDGPTFIENLKEYSRVIESYKSRRLIALNVVMFVQPNCPWSTKMIELLTTENQINNIQIVDMTTSDGIEIAKKYGADKQPVPSFISKSSRIGSIGYRESIDSLIEDLTPKVCESNKLSHGDKETIDMLITSLMPFISEAKALIAQETESPVLDKYTDNSDN